MHKNKACHNVARAGQGLHVSPDGVDRLGIEVSGLPRDVRKLLAVVGHVDSAAGGHFEDGVAWAQVMCQDLTDGFLVALGGWRALHFVCRHDVWLALEEVRPKWQKT